MADGAEIALFASTSGLMHKRSFCQDRLGTNMKNQFQLKSEAFPTGSTHWINGTAKVDGSTLVGTWAAGTLYDQAGGAKLSGGIAKAHSVEYACAAVPKCAAVNSAGMPLEPLQIALAA
jgi:hypothetical protein